MSRSDTLFAPVLVSDTGPVKSLPALASVIAPAPVVKLAAPAPAACTIAPVWVIEFAPVAVTASVPLPTLEAPRMIAFASVTATLFAPLLFRLTAPMKLFAALVSVIEPAPALKVAAPAPAACVSAPVCVERAVRLHASRVPVPTVTVPSASAFASRIDTVVRPAVRRATPAR